MDIRKMREDVMNIPHIGGGGSAVLLFFSLMRAYSLRKWGSTYVSPTLYKVFSIFPTYVGFYVYKLD